MNLSTLFLIFLAIALPSGFIGYQIRIIIECWDAEHADDEDSVE